MSLFGRHRWFALTVGITLALAVVSLTVPRGPALTGMVDVGYLLLTLTVGVAMLLNAWSGQGTVRRFWALMGWGCILWALNGGAWVYFEVLRHTAFPDPSFMDVFLFLHPVPMIAAVGLRPHRSEGEQKFRVGTLDFLMLLVWWVFLYAFVVFPPQYALLNVAEYDRNFAPLYMAECGVLVLVLGIAALRASRGWKMVYLNLMAASAVYAVGSRAVNLAITKGAYYTGCLYDVPLMGSVLWMAATALTAREWKLEATPPPTTDDTWGTRALRLAMLAILSLPALGLWAYRWDPSPAPERRFRLLTVLAAMLVLGAFVFVRQYLQDQALIHLLENSRRSFENEQRLQNHLVQREKLASLGQLIAGAAHEIDHPLTAIMGYSEKLWNERLTGEQDTLVRKIVNQSHRTRELISNLLSFAQQSSGEKTMVDLRMLLQRSVQMRELQRHDQKIRIETVIEPNLPLVWGDGHQLFQAFVQIVENALDALEEAGGGLLQVSAHCQGEEVVVQFSDSGPGVKEPHRVFDPFYTTKPIGKGTGLGLSAVYGMVQDHRGQITCQNKAEGGALFVLRLPMERQADPRALAAVQS
jgi:signal transduction histidine kinase